MIHIQQQRRDEPVQSAGESIQVLGFLVGEQEYAFHILDIVVIERLENVVRLPRMPQFVEGVMRIREEIVPLVKLRTRFGLPERENDAQTRVVVVEQEDELVGFVVDCVTMVRESLQQNVEPPPPVTLTINSRFVRGVFQNDWNMIVLLSPFEILFEDEVKRLNQAMVRIQETGILGES